MPLAVLMTDDAARDLEEIIAYIERYDTQARARHVLTKIDAAMASLTDTPGRGVHPPELMAVGIREYQEVFFKPYRIIYRIIADRVYVLLISDGRRDMQALLQRRLLAM